MQPATGDEVALTLKPTLTEHTGSDNLVGSRDGRSGDRRQVPDGPSPEIGAPVAVGFDLSYLVGIRRPDGTAHSTH